MNDTRTQNAETGTGPILAFAFVVVGVFLSIFGSSREITNATIIAMVILGTCYLFMGIYGYIICAKSTDRMIVYFYFAGQLLIGGSLIFLSRGAGLSPLLLMPLIGQTVMLLAPRPMILFNGLIVLIYFGAMRYFASGWEPFWNNVPFFLAGHIILILILQIIGDEDRVHHENARLVKELEAANRTLKAYSEQVEELTITRERNRMAREIHDGVGHYLTVINMQIQAAIAVMAQNREKSGEILERAMIQTQTALSEIRKSVSILHDSDDEKIPLAERLEEFRINIQDGNITPHIDILGTPRTLSAQYEQMLLRTLQEGVQNCIKHSHAANIWLLLDFRQTDRTVLHIRDDGSGCSAPGEGFGLISLQERARLLNGQFSFGNRSEGGFFLEVDIPV